MRRASLVTVVACVSVLVGSATARASEATRLADAAAVIRSIQADISPELWSRAHCVAVIPDLKKAAFVFGGEYGKGVMSCRTGEAWGAPVFLQLIRGSWGFQIGAEQADVVLLVMNETGVQKLLENKVTLGANASVAAGPVGRKAEASTDAQLKAEILSYSRAQGLFAGVDITGGVLRPDEDANRDAYGPNATPRTILASRALSAPTEAVPFLNALGAVPSAPAAAVVRPTPPAGSSEATSTAQTTTSTSPADLRGRIAEMQRTLDRLLSGAEPSPVGTTGTTVSGGATVTVDREQLTLLREQLDALARAAGERR